MRLGLQLVIPQGERERGLTIMTLTTPSMERAHHAAMDGDTSLPERPVRRTFSGEDKQQIPAE